MIKYYWNCIPSLAYHMRLLMVQRAASYLVVVWKFGRINRTPELLFCPLREAAVFLLSE